MMDTVYVPVEANSVDARASIPSDADTTSGYYLSYEVNAGLGGGFTGISWCLEKNGNPFENSSVTTPEEIVAHYNANGNLNYFFSTWFERVDQRAVSNFCNDLMNDDRFYGNGCIVMVH